MRRNSSNAVASAPDVEEEQAEEPALDLAA
jgi:hypothetical protein